MLLQPGMNKTQEAGRLFHGPRGAVASHASELGCTRGPLAGLFPEVGYIQPREYMLLTSPQMMDLDIRGDHLLGPKGHGNPKMESKKLKSGRFAN